MVEQARERRRDEPRIFTIPPGAPFLPTFVEAFLDGRLVPGFGAEAGPLGLAEATIYVPTRRSARALAAAFADRLKPAVTFLPRILPLGDRDAIETDALLDDARFDTDDSTLAAIDDLSRRMALTRLILAWAASVRHALLPSNPGATNEALLVASTPVDAWHLSGDLARLIDELILAGVDRRALDTLGTETFDRYWGITLDFLKIATEHWPKILAERNLVDPASRETQLIESEIARLSRADRPQGPVIVAGAIGADLLTGRLLDAIARLPQGAVVLPGLDQSLDEASWTLLGRPDTSHGHPQMVLHRCLAAMGATRSSVAELGTVVPPLAARARFVSEALRPAETTEAWALAAAQLDRPVALERISVIEARDEGEEALALAIALRESLESSGSAVLVTPDRALARRVRADLLRWGIEIDDSGGEPLAITPAGSLARLALECVSADFDPVAVLALLGHTAVRLGRPRATVERLARKTEMLLLRGIVPAGALLDPAALVAELRARSTSSDLPSEVRQARSDTFDAIERLLLDLLKALSPVSSLSGRAGLERWLPAHDTALTSLTDAGREDSALGGADGARLAALLADLREAADPAITLDRVEYRTMFERIATETIVRGPARSHPRLKILGPLEMRLLDADRVVLGGLDEAVWPPQATTDAFLNRPMRAALGLAPPEWRVGIAAHDFEMALGHPEVVISRAAKRGGSPTVPSRFLQRLAAVAGDEWATCRKRGQAYLDMARALDRPDHLVTIKRPAPKPPVELRPIKLSVTRIETLRRDPYAIYADKILRLRPLDPVGAAIGPREWGTAFHGVLRTFIDRVQHGPHPPDALAGLLRNAETAFAQAMDEPGTRAFLGPRVRRWVEGFHAWDAGRRTSLSALHAEKSGSLAIGLDDGSRFELTATADRIEVDGNGAIRIVDYKTGAAPSAREVAAGFAPQLTLEAAIALGGGFAALDAAAIVDEAFYVKFGTGRKPAITQLKWSDKTLHDVVADHLAGLKDLLNLFRDPGTGYLARPYPQFASRFSDYDHLSRVKEWSATGGHADPSGDGAE